MLHTNFWDGFYLFGGLIASIPTQNLNKSPFSKYSPPLSA